MREFREELEVLVSGVDSYRRAEYRPALEAVLAAGVRSRAELAALVLDRGAGVDREHGATFLRLMTDETAQQAWIALLADPDSAWRSNALSALSSLRAERAVPAIIAVLQRDPDDHVRTHAALVLGECGPASAAALDVMLAMLHDPSVPPGVRGGVAEALHRYDDARVPPALLAAVEDPAPEVRYYAAFALACLRHTPALPVLKRLAATEQATLPCGSVRDEMLDAIKSIRRKPRRGG